MFATFDGRARFAACAYVPVAEKSDARFPFRLTTGRLRDQWHGMSRTGTIAPLYAHAPEPALELHPADAARRGFVAGDLIRIESRRGAVVVPLALSNDVRPGSAYLPMHWGSATLAGDGSAGINAVTAKTFCPASKQPELKHAAVRAVKAALRWRLAAFGFPVDAASLATMRDEARAAASAFEYASIVLIGGERAALLMRIAASSSPEPSRIEAIDRIFALHGRDVARYDDATREIARRVRVTDGKLAAVRLSGDLSGEAWLREWLTEERDINAGRAMLLLPSARPPGGRALRGRIVCSCFNVSENEIESRRASLECSNGRALELLQAELKCGTNCGSCLPEVRRLVIERRSSAEVAAP